MDVISKQTTHVRAVSIKLEWSIDQFSKLMRLFRNGEHIASQQFGSPLYENVTWELHIYPNGKRAEDLDKVSFFLRQIGLAKGEEPIMTEFKIYARDVNGKSVSVCRDVKDFVHQQGRGKFQVPRPKMAEALYSDGSLQLTCEVEFIPPGTKLCAETDQSALDEETEVSMKKLLDTSLFSDCCIKVGDTEYKAHRCILGLHSEVFRSMFQQESMSEAQNGIIDIADSHETPVYSMLEFMYTGVTAGLTRCPDEVLALAEKYAIGNLKAICESRLAKSLTQKNICDTLVFADTYHASLLRGACVKFLAAHHKEVLKSADWQRLKADQPALANELLEMVLSGESTESTSYVVTASGSTNESGRISSTLQTPRGVKREPTPQASSAKAPPKKRGRKGTK